MLEGLFDIKAPQAEGTKYKYLVKVNAQHAVFNGHFPGQPVLPGVAMIYLTRWITQQQLGKDMEMSEASQIKFLSLIDPTVTPEFDYIHETVKEENGKVFVKGEIKKGDTTFFKISAQYQG